MRRSILLLLPLAAVIALAAEPIALWPGLAPGETGGLPPEVDTTKPDVKLTGGKRVTRIGNVSTPTLTLFRPTAAKDTGAAVLVFPGGGYSILAYDLEGTEICEWLNSIGVTGVLVKYRVPARRDGPRRAAPLQDAQRALSLVRSRASEWKLDPQRIGVLGFSAGGHLTASISNNFEKRTYEPADAADKFSCRPDFAVLIYPAFLTVKDEGDKIAPDLPVSARTPPSFLVQAEDDNVRVENSLFYFLALKNAKVPAEMHLYASGGHGYGLRPDGKSVTSWPKRAEEWMRALGVLR